MSFRGVKALAFTLHLSQELKMAIKASGEHKQRVIIHIAVDGLKIRDEKTGVRKNWFRNG